MRRRAALALAALLATGCAAAPSMGGPFVANRSFIDYERVGSRVEGRSCEWRLVGILPLTVPRVNDAFADAMSKAPAEATGLIAVTIHETRYINLLAILGGPSICFKISGIPARRTGAEVAGQQVPEAPPIP